MTDKSSKDGGKRQKDLRELFGKDATQRHRDSTPTVSTVKLPNSDTGARPKNTSSSHSDTTEVISPWLSNIMKQVLAATNIDDIKGVCCELIAKVAELANNSNQARNSSAEAIKETIIIKEDLNKLSKHYDDEIEEIKNDAIVYDEYVTKCDFDKVKEKVDDLEGRSRRNNIRISNVHEGEEYGYDDSNMENFVNMVIRDSLEIDLPRGAIQRAHRVGPKKPGKNRDIIAYFLKYTDKELVRKAGPKKRPTFGGQKIFINEDFSSMVIEKRKVLGEEMRRRRNNGQRAWLSRDKLFFVQDDFVHEITAEAPLFYLTDPRRRFKARQQYHPRRQSTTNNGSRDISATSNASPRSQSGHDSTNLSAMSISTSPVTQHISSPSLMAQGPAPQIRPSQPIFTLAPENRKSRTPPTPPENAAKQYRADEINGATASSEHLDTNLRSSANI